MVRLKPKIIDELALMICGDGSYAENFIYRSSPKLTKFFKDIDLDYRHNRSKRINWAIEVLKELNQKSNLDGEFPSIEIQKVIEHLLDPTEFVISDKSHDSAINVVNKIIKSHNLIIKKDEKTGNVTLTKYPDLISTVQKETKNHSYILPLVFDIPEDPTIDKCVSVMMPFSTEFNTVMEKIREACSNVGMSCKRADDFWKNSFIIQDIFELIYRSKIVIVDFSNKNSNVFYEAGIAHTLGKEVIPIAQNIDDVPFDLRPHRILTYLNNNEGLEDLRVNLEKRLKILKNKLKENESSRLLSVTKITDKEDTEKSSEKINLSSENEMELDISQVLSYENKKNNLIKDGKELPYLESKPNISSGHCIIYADIYNQFFEKSYLLETTIMQITIDDLKKIINDYYSSFEYHHTSAFGINQETCSWFGFGPLNFIKSLEMQDYRYSSLKKNNDYIHHSECSCFVDELKDAIFYIHSQPNNKRDPDETITLRHVNIGFLFKNPPYDNIFHKFFEKIGSIPTVIKEINQPLTISKGLDSKFETEGFIITNPDNRLGGWVCGIYGNNSKDMNITEVSNDKIVVNFGQQHEVEDKCEYKVLSVNATTLPAANFPATILNYRGNWKII